MELSFNMATQVACRLTLDRGTDMIDFSNNKAGYTGQDVTPGVINS